MKAILSRLEGAPGYLLAAADGREVLFQTDWDYPALAMHFGYRPCPYCTYTDGIVDCDHKTAGEMIALAADWLDDHEGDVTEVDDLYFERE
jgi:hypothetical protein